MQGRPLLHRSRYEVWDCFRVVSTRYCGRVRRHCPPSDSAVMSACLLYGASRVSTRRHSDYMFQRVQSWKAWPDRMLPKLDRCGAIRAANPAPAWICSSFTGGANGHSTSVQHLCIGVIICWFEQFIAFGGLSTGVVRRKHAFEASILRKSVPRILVLPLVMCRVIFRGLRMCTVCLNHCQAGMRSSHQ